MLGLVLVASLVDATTMLRARRVHSPLPEVQGAPVGEERGEHQQASALFEHADDVAADVEQRFTNLAGSDVAGQAFNHGNGEASPLAVVPNLFEGCLLFRGVAAPLRVVSALERVRHASVRDDEDEAEAEAEAEADADAGAGANATAPEAAAPAAPNATNETNATKDLAEEAVEAEAATEEELDAADAPEDELLIKQFTPRDANASLVSTMEANFRSVAGTVQVIARGPTARWTSKSVVPMAGYLCLNGVSQPTFHTLDTPCVATTIGEEGEGLRPDDKQAEVWVGSHRFVFPDLATAEHACRGLAEAIALDTTYSSWEPSTLDLGTGNGYASSDGPKVVPEPGDEFGPQPNATVPNASAPMPAAAPTTTPAPAAAADADAAAPAPALVQRELKVNAHVAATVQVRKAVASLKKQAKLRARAWTTGEKKVLVVLMDWKAGDTSRSPYSRQSSNAVAHYRDTIMPRVAEAFETMSGGQFTIDVTVLPQIVNYALRRSSYVSGGYPFPGLYDGAQVSVEGRRDLQDEYAFRKFDLVYVVAPQQNPVATKGVAWVGAKGAMCNGCEAISDNFQVMVAVHEIGHNLGLMHAASKDLSYGNPFDWMGNYPDSDGLTYGMGYLYKLGWIPGNRIFAVTDATLPGLSARVHLKPFDAGASGVVGVHVTLAGESRDVYVSYRSLVAEGSKGVYITLQDRMSQASELVDASCHSATQLDSSFKDGYSYLSPSGEVAIVVESVTAELATLRVYHMTSDADRAKFRGRALFTDGVWKCPRTCVDANLLVAGVSDGCHDLKEQGYCTGKITMMGSSFRIGEDLCPVSCDECAQALDGPLLKDGGCQDWTGTINGMSCSRVAARGHCDATTSVGHVGFDLCPASCGNCPPAPTTSSGSFSDPSVKETVGEGAGDGADTAEGGNDSDAADEAAQDPAPATTTPAPEDEEEEAAGEGCVDDPAWVDVDGDGCQAYKEYLEQHPDLATSDVCSYGDGGAQRYCRATCDSCEPSTETCADQPCVGEWYNDYGRCYQCANWPSYCDQAHFVRDCPLTCGVCTAPENTTPDPERTTTSTTSTTTTTTTTTTPEVCEDHECVDAWVHRDGQCLHCRDFLTSLDTYCADQEFVASCKATCKVCSAEAVCQDDFEIATCSRYLSWGWCSFSNVAQRCRDTCGLCAEELRVEARLEKGPADAAFGLSLLLYLLFA